MSEDYGAIYKTKLPVKVVKKDNCLEDFNVSILSTDASFDLFKHFGFQSGKTTDKFENFNDKKRTSNGCYVVTAGTNGYISGHIIKRIDVGTHFMFIAEVTNGELFNDTPSATYTYYHEHIKPQPKKQVETKQTVWRCEICGYEYVGEEVPDDFICPICKHGKEAFKKVN